MDNDFLDFLRKAMMSGMGIPSSALQYADEIEFARSLSMQNGMFLRSLIVKQKKLTPPFTSLYQDLYENEFGTNIVTLFDQMEIEKNIKLKKKSLQGSELDTKEITDSEKSKDEDEKVKNNLVEIKNIKVKFPSPAALNSTNLSEQIGVGQGIIEAINTAMFNQNGTIDEEHKFKFTQELYKKYIPNIDWDDIFDTFESTKVDSVIDKFDNKIKQAATDTSSEM